MEKSHKIYLAIDTCFASKRWTEPKEWMKVVKSLGVNYVEASADTELDPLYLGEDYLERWKEQVLENGQKHGVKVKNLYSGHGTYATLGLAHTDRLVRERFLEKWLKPMCRVAADLGAGLGFYCHAFCDSILQDGEKYIEFKKNLYSDLAQLACYAKQVGCSQVGCEQMYSPHQIPWTIDGTKEMLKEINRLSGGANFYVTVDTGHQSGQRKFLRPNAQTIKKDIEKKSKGEKTSGLWLGSLTAYDIFDKASDFCAIEEIEKEMDKYPYMFAKYSDGDTYNWLSNFACYSPIIHLQQTDGLKSAHLSFTPENNEKGIIQGEKVIEAIKQSYARKSEQGYPDRVEEIYLTLEPFTGTADINRDALFNIARSVKYWRQFVPFDGIELSEL